MGKMRVIVQTTDYGAACNVGGPVNTTYKTFDIEAPEVSAFIAEKMGSYAHRSVVGVEVIPATGGQPND